MNAAAKSRKARPSELRLDLILRRALHSTVVIGYIFAMLLLIAYPV